MPNEWVIVELSDMIENPSYFEIENAVTAVFGDDIDFFIPIYHEKMGSYVSTSTLMQGYVFIKDCEEVRSALVNVKDHRLFQGALTYGGKIQTIPSTTIAGLRKKLKNSLKRKFESGKKVKIIEGAFKNLVGEVVGIEDDGMSIMVRINLVSRELLAPIPATLVEELK
jgi:transcription antitermination factor NusG